MSDRRSMLYTACCDITNGCECSSLVELLLMLLLLEVRQSIRKAICWIFSEMATESARVGFVFGT
jgi:hypothetical protein